MQENKFEKGHVIRLWYLLHVPVGRITDSADKRQTIIYRTTAFTKNQFPKTTRCHYLQTT